MATTMADEQYGGDQAVAAADRAALMRERLGAIIARLDKEAEERVQKRDLVEKRWPFRMHATYEETIARALDVFEKVNREIPFQGLHWWFDHAETVSPKSIDRIKALGGGIAIQHRMAFQGEYFAARYGARAAEQTPPIRRMLDVGLPVGAGTDATRVASYNPWTSLAWLVTGKTVGGMRMSSSSVVIRTQI